MNGWWPLLLVGPVLLVVLRIATWIARAHQRTDKRPGYVDLRRRS